MVCVKTTSWNQHQSLLTLPFAFGGFLKERSLMEDKEIRAFILLTFFQIKKPIALSLGSKYRQVNMSTLYFHTIGYFWTN